MMEIKVLSEMARVLLDGIPKRYQTINELYAFQGECASFQTAIKGTEWLTSFQVEAESDLPIDMYQVRYMPVQLTGRSEDDQDFLKNDPGLFPDFLDYKQPGSILDFHGDNWQSLYFMCEKVTAGDHPITLTFKTWPQGEEIDKITLTLHVSKKRLPKQDFYYTRWFHCDCLADYYNVPVFSPRHWRIMENFLKKAAQRGMNVVLTPIHTPPLDTDIGSERPTVQLVDIEDHGDGRYSFSFDKLDKWVRMTKRCGIEYLEMAHLFSQWGLKAAPKIVAKVPSGEVRRIFGWDTPAEGESYLNFISQYLPALYAHLEELGIADRCFFHVSDEPGMDSIAPYMRLKKKVQELLPKVHFIDAMSELDFYRQGACQHPIPAVNHIEPFHQENIPDLWTYYCCSQKYLVPNSFISMPGERMRALGVLMYAYNIKGFLQWGYNFYYGRNSRYLIDPYRSGDGDATWPGGDPFIVYPSRDGHALDCLRSIEMQKVLEDFRSLQLCEKKLGREKTMELVMEGVEKPLSFTDYPRSEQYFLHLRKKLYQALS